MASRPFCNAAGQIPRHEDLKKENQRRTHSSAKLEKPNVPNLKRKKNRASHSEPRK